MEEDVADVFEGIAETRMELLHGWTEEYWGCLERLALQLLSLQEALAFEEREGATAWAELFAATRARAADFSEIFVLNKEGKVISTTYSRHLGTVYAEGSVIHEGLRYSRSGAEGRKCLFGPYSDPVTLAAGPSTSAFHDAMTLLFILPVVSGGERLGTLCGRVPNDVIGDMIQRESGHVYPDSGDNYLFMAKPGLNRQIAPGMALSRSRFEDRTFTHGENLKDGVTTAWGTVSVKHHTELELMFTDPATGELHPGVAGTIKNGNNLFVAFPGYSDYRHIPVIGKGVTFQLPHCPDVWGMMCEGDLEEVYRIRGIAWKSTRLQLPISIGFTAASVCFIAVLLLLGLSSPIWLAGAAGGLQLLHGHVLMTALRKKVTEPAASKLRSIQRFIRLNAEGKGDLTQRLKTADFENDELGELAKWLNNMIDSEEGIMLQVKRAAADVLQSQEQLNQSTAVTASSTEQVSDHIVEMVRSIRKQLKDLDTVNEVVGEMRSALLQMEESAAGQVAAAQTEVVKIGEKMGHIASRVEETNRTIASFVETTRRIQDVLQVIHSISAQTNLLALNASIEAARVGEHGRGFAVVAGEIRKLADSARRSTEEIQEIVEQIYEGANQAFASMKEGSRVVAEGKQLAAAATELLHGSSHVDLKKTQIVDEVALLMNQITEVSRDNRQISSEVEGRVQQLKTDFTHVHHTTHHVEVISQFLQQLMGQFRLNETRRR